MKGGILTDPSLAGVEIGSPQWFAAQRQMIRDKPLIKRCYDLWYKLLLADADSVVATTPLHVVELGSGSSYIKSLRPEVITSDIAPGVADLVIDGRTLPFEDGSVKALLLTHVFHHIPDVGLFLDEAMRVLAPGGVISMVECANTAFGRFFFKRIHPEPFDEKAVTWAFHSEGRMFDSNQALSYLVFQRDRAKFEAIYPMLKIEKHQYLPWLSYLLSGGVNLRNPVPRFMAKFIVSLDSVVQPLDPIFAVHWHITLRKVK